MQIDQLLRRQQYAQPVHLVVGSKDSSVERESRLLVANDDPSRNTRGTRSIASRVEALLRVRTADIERTLGLADPTLETVECELAAHQQAGVMAAVRRPSRRVALMKSASEQTIWRKAGRRSQHRGRIGHA